MLPPLPKQNKDREAKFGVKFREWIEANPLYSCTFEMKDTRGASSFPFNELSDKQYAFNMKVKGDKGVLLRVLGMKGEPDYSYHRSSPAYIVIKFPRFWVMVDIETLLLERNRSKSKSLTAQRASEICVIKV